MSGCRPLTREESDKVLSLLKTQRDKTLFILGIKSGFRISELLTIRVRDIIQNDQVVNRIKVSRMYMKANRTREVALNPVAKEYILELILRDKLEPNHYLFRSRKGDNKPITRVQAWYVLKQAFNTAGLLGTTGTHSMRKSFGMNVYRALGNDLVATQKALGHSDIGSTIAYLPTDDEEIDKVIVNL